MKKILIITGGSKGIGKGIATTYGNNGYEIHSISRTQDPSPDPATIHQYEADLSQTEHLETTLTSILKQFDPASIERIVLINNAANLSRVGRLENNSTRQIENTIQLNTLAPLLLMRCFVQVTSEWKCKKKIINISSGAARKAYVGWSVYCASKAALDMMSRVIGMEQELVSNGVRILSLYPGVADTQMQATIRGSKGEEFRDLERFRQMKSNGLLNDIYTLGKEIYDIDHLDNYENGAVVSVEDYRK